MRQTELQMKLGERIKKLSDESLSDEEFSRELERSKATAVVAKEMIKNATLIVQANKSVGALTAEIVADII